jgi:putative spermidine/putrescine transport system permease protein
MQKRLFAVLLVLPALVMIVLCFIVPFFASIVGAFEVGNTLGLGNFSKSFELYLNDMIFALVIVALFVFLESLDEFTGTYFVGAPDVTTLPLLLYTAGSGGNYQIASITALLLLVPSIGFMLVVERFLRADVLSKVGH